MASLELCNTSTYLRSFVTRETNSNGVQCVAGVKHVFRTRLTITKASQNNQPVSSLQQEDITPPGCSRIKVELKKPLGLKLEEDEAGNIYVVEVFPGGNADRSGVVEVGDQLIATSAVVYDDVESYQGVNVRKGMQVVRLNVHGERFDTVVAAIGTHPGYMKVALELQKCKVTSNNGAL